MLKTMTRLRGSELFNRLIFPSFWISWFPNNSEAVNPTSIQITPESASKNYEFTYILLYEFIILFTPGKILNDAAANIPTIIIMFPIS